jgi:hypothetical protein
MTKKLNPLLCAAALSAAGAFALTASAQKRAEAPADAHSTHREAQSRDAKAHADCPMKEGGARAKDDAGHNVKEDAGHSAHAADLNARGEAAMGFSQTGTTHHFRLTRDGGLILVEAKEAGDARNRELVRRHLAHVARMFAGGDFDTPALVHARTPPGADAMARLKADIVYTYEETERGGLVRIDAKSPEALAAVHQFLRFQIEDHQTGDPTEVRD